MKTKLGFELQTCSRCGGSGQHSYCQAYGTTCFKCGGTGVVLNKRGVAAKKFFYASITKPAVDVQVGDLMQETYPTTKWLTVLSVEEDTNNENHLTIKTKHCCHGMPKDSTKVAVSSREEYYEKAAKAGEYQDKLTKAGKLMKKYEGEVQ